MHDNIPTVQRVTRSHEKLDITTVPPGGFSGYFAPSGTAMRPATSLIGVRSGSSRDGSSTVSYAMAIAPDAMTARVRSSSAAKWKYVKIT